MNEITLKDFTRSFGTNNISNDCKSLIAKADFRYERLDDRERDKLMLDILKTIGGDGLIKSSQERQPQWEKGWSENLECFIDSGYRIEELVPKYMRSDRPIRLGYDYAIPHGANFEQDYADVFRLWLFEKYFQDVDAVYDFGCGTGYNLTMLAKLFPGKKLYGLDWATASQKILVLLAKHHGMNMIAHPFDFYSPNESLKIADNSAFMTFAALEQVGSDYEAFLQFVLKKSPALCVNVEPLLELYDENSLVDYLAIKYHKRRNYLNGYLSRLKELESRGRITIQKVQRTYFGNLYHEAYSYVVWRPREINRRKS